MTTAQQTTINQIRNKIQKVSPWVDSEHIYTNQYGYPSNWVAYTLAEVKHDKTHFYANVVINSKGNIKRGSFNQFKPVKIQL